MHRRDPWRELVDGLGSSPPRWLIALMGVLVAGLVGQYLDALAPYVAALRLAPEVWEDGQLWRLVTYALMGSGSLSLWGLSTLVLLYWLLIDTLRVLGRARLRAMMLGGVLAASVGATVAQFASDQVGGPGCDWGPFWMMQGQTVLIAVLVASFAARNRGSTLSHVTLMLGLRIPSRWLVPIQLIGAAIGLVTTGDLGGFIGIATASYWGWRYGRPRPVSLL